MPLIENPGEYTDRVGTNVRFDAKVKEALEKFLKARGITMADYMNTLVARDLKKEGFIK